MLISQPIAPVSPRATEASGPPRLDSLTALRFFAALMVVLSHSVGEMTQLPGLRWLTVEGFTGVSFFFVLSGFVLTWSHREDDRATAFYRRRFARIVPLNILTWAVAGCLVWQANGRLDRGAALAGLLLVQSWVPLDRIAFGMNGVSWSLSCEVFFYAIFPFVVPRLLRQSRRELRKVAIALAVVIALLALAGRLTLSPTLDRDFLYANPLCRVTEFLLGMLLARAVRDGWRPRTSFKTAGRLVVVAYGAVCLLNYLSAGTSWGGLDMPSADALMLAPWMLLIACAAAVDVDHAASAVRRRWLVQLGMQSFALYLTHDLLRRLVSTLLPHLVRWSVPERVAVEIGYLAVALAVAAVAHRCVERPLEMKLRGGRSRLS